MLQFIFKLLIDLQKKMLKWEFVKVPETIPKHNQTNNDLDHDSKSNTNSSVGETIAIIIFSIILITGLIGNICNMLVFGKKRMRKNSTFRYLFYLSISDLLVLVVGATDIIITRIFKSQIRTHSTLTCKFHTFSTYFLTHTSSLILMAVSIDRAIAVSNVFVDDENPIVNKVVSKQNSSNIINESNLCTIITESHATSIREQTSTLMNSFSNQNIKALYRKTSHPFFIKFFLNKYVDLVTLVIFVLVFGLNSHYIYYLKLEISVDGLIGGRNFTNNDYPQTEQTIYSHMSEDYRIEDQIDIKYSCFAQRNSRYEYFLINYWFWMDLVVYSLLPFTTMTISSIIIVLKIRKVNKKYKQYILNENYKTNKKIYLNKLKKNRQIYIMLLNSIFWFLFTMVNSIFYFNLLLVKNFETLENVQ
jgi:hypothetical protein